MLLACACAPSRDTVPVVPEVRADAGEAATSEGYVAIAKKEHVTLALASHAGVRRDAALTVLERVSSEMEACVANLVTQNQLARGAARFQAKKRGTETLVDVKTEGGAAAVHNAVLCVVLPLRRYPFPEGPEGSTLVLDALWGP